MVKPEVVINELFYFLTLSLIAAIILEIIFPNIVLAYFNLNWLFLLVLLSGALTLFINKAAVK